MKARKQKQTFKLRPTLKEKFRPSEFRSKINEICKEKLDPVVLFSNEECILLSQEISMEIKEQLKADNYKFCVSAVIGEKKGQGVQAGSNCAWDVDTDS